MAEYDAVVRHYRSLLGDRLIGLVLYGSRARGGARDDSDADVFLLAEDLPRDPFDRAHLLRPPSFNPRTDAPLSLRALTLEEYDKDISSLDLDIALDGKILYDPGGAVERRLALVRQRIEEAGLYRTSDLVWRWKRKPTTAHWAVSWGGVRV